MIDPNCYRCHGRGTLPDRHDGTVKCPRCHDGVALGDQGLDANEIEIDRLRAEVRSLGEKKLALKNEVSDLIGKLNGASQRVTLLESQLAGADQIGAAAMRERDTARADNRHLREAMQSIAHVTKSCSADKVDLFAQLGHVHKIANDTLGRVKS